MKNAGHSYLFFPSSYLRDNLSIPSTPISSVPHVGYGTIIRSSSYPSGYGIPGTTPPMLFAGIPGNVNLGGYGDATDWQGWYLFLVNEDDKGGECSIVPSESLRGRLYKEEGKNDILSSLLYWIQCRHWYVRLCNNHVMFCSHGNLKLKHFFQTWMVGKQSVSDSRRVYQETDWFQESCFVEYDPVWICRWCFDCISSCNNN